MLLSRKQDIMVTLYLAGVVQKQPLTELDTRHSSRVRREDFRVIGVLVRSGIVLHAVLLKMFGACDA